MNSLATTSSKHSASFRDPSGFIFRDETGTILRQVNQSYQADYQQLMDGGLYADLVSDESLIEHEEVSIESALTEDAIAVLEPRFVHFSSNPSEWAFSAYKDAALLTLDIERRALKHGMTLKDASAYNIQFDGAKPIFIDTLSFEKYEDGAPWQAYAQFCRHFLAPLLLMSKTNIDLGKLMTTYIDGIPLTLTSKLLPRKTWMSMGCFIHLHLHAKMESWYSDTSSEKSANKQKTQLSKAGLKNLIDDLSRLINKLTWQPQGTEWADYYKSHSYTDDAFEEKKSTVLRMIQETSPSQVWDLGANTGVFSRLATELDINTWSFDIDPACVEMNYLDCQKRQERRLLPLRLDLSNPTPSTGWANEERPSLADRGPTDLILALALIHHISITNNVPFDNVAKYFSSLTKHLVIEFVPKHDSQAQRLLRSRVDIFDAYTQPCFESSFSNYFEIMETVTSDKTDRVMYLMKSKNLEL